MVWTNDSRTPRRRLIAAVATLALLAVPASAGATTYCVADPACVQAGGTAEPGVQAALIAAEPIGSADIVKIGPGTFTGPFTYASPDSVTIQGAGRGQTTLTSDASVPADFKRTLSVTGQAGQGTRTVRDLSIHTNGTSARGLELDYSGAIDVDVSGTATYDAMGVIITDGGSFTGGSVVLGGSYDLGIQALGAGIAVTDAQVDASTGIQTDADLGADIDVVRTSVRCAVVCVQATTGHTTLDDVLLDARPATPSWAAALSVYDNGNHFSDVAVDARNVTILATPAHETAAIRTTVEDAGYTREVHVRDSIISGASVSSAMFANPGSAVVTFDHVADDAGVTHTESLAPGATGTFTSTAPIPVSGPLFADVAAGDFRLAAGSSLIDAGTPGPLAAGESATDLAGAARLSDGDGNGTAVRDPGAYEYGPAAAAPGSPAAGDPAGAAGALAAPAGVPAGSPAPHLTGLRVTLRPRRTARARATLRFHLDREARVTLRVRKLRGAHWVLLRGSITAHGRVGANAVAFSGRLAGHLLGRGRYQLLARALDTAGHPGTAAMATLHAR